MPLLHRLKAFALAQGGDPEGAERELRAAVAAARAQHQPYETLVALDALAALGDGRRRRCEARRARTETS